MVGRGKGRPLFQTFEGRGASGKSKWGQPARVWIKAKSQVQAWDEDMGIRKFGWKIKPQEEMAHKLWKRDEQWAQNSTVGNANLCEEQEEERIPWRWKRKYWQVYNENKKLRGGSFKETVIKPLKWYKESSRMTTEIFRWIWWFEMPSDSF